jgi:predicted nuclease with RNAse H fold
MSWAGIDVGGRRKGFHGAAVDGTKVIKGPHRLGGVDEMMRWLFAIEPEVVALDSPKTCARRGERSRECERELMKAICGIRWTPEAAELEGNKYYEWIRCGRELYEALKRETSRRGWQVIEVFPTASWTVWAGKRGETRVVPAQMCVRCVPAGRCRSGTPSAVGAR